MAQSINFDRAADLYDATRAVSPEIDAKRTDTIVAELKRASADRLLEVGVGTGRIARPLLARGVPVTGVDIAPRMMAKLREQLGPGYARADLLLADATRLPLAAGSFRAALMVHVLHLVSDWRRSLSEVARVLEPGGIFVHDSTHYTENNPWQQVFAKREEILAGFGFTPRKRPSEDDIAAYLGGLGATRRRIAYGERDDQEVVEEVIERGRNRVDSWTWEIPESIFPAFLEQYEAHARELLGGLDATNMTHIDYGVDVWTFVGATGA